MTQENKELDRSLQRVNQVVLDLQAKAKSIVMSTVDKNGLPHASYAPFAKVGNNYYVFLSKVAKHCGNLTDNPQLSFMLIEDDSEAKMVYARIRLTYDAQAHKVEVNSQEWNEGLNALYERHGPIVKELSTMGDFHLFRLTPTKGTFVRGFGKAYIVHNNGDVVDPVHLQEGHKFNEGNGFDHSKK